MVLAEDTDLGMSAEEPWHRSSEYREFLEARRTRLSGTSWRDLQ